MTQLLRKRTVALLKDYPFLCGSLVNLEERIRAEERLYRRLRMREADPDAVPNYVTIEDLYARKLVLLTRIYAVKRALGALPLSEQELLAALFFSPNRTPSPFDLMEKYGIEKSALYARRAKAIDHFARLYGREEILGESAYCGEKGRIKSGF